MAGRHRTAPFPTAAFVPGGWFITIAAAATHPGLARRALDEARNELRGKVNRYTQAPLLEHPATQRNLEAAEGRWFACRTGLREALGAAWQRALRGEPATHAERLDARVAGTTAVHKCAEIVRTAYVRFVEDLMPQQQAQATPDAVGGNPEQQLLACAFGKFKDNGLLGIRTEAEKMLMLAALNLVECIAETAPQRTT